MLPAASSISRKRSEATSAASGLRKTAVMVIRISRSSSKQRAVGSGLARRGSRRERAIGAAHGDEDGGEEEERQRHQRADQLPHRRRNDGDAARAHHGRSPRHPASATRDTANKTENASGTAN